MRSAAFCWIAILLVNAPLHGQTPGGTYVLELSPLSGHEQEWPRRTMRLVLSSDTAGFMRLGDLTRAPSELLRGFPPNACFAVTVGGDAFRWAHRARWIPGRLDTVRVKVEASADDETEVKVVIHGDSVSGIEIHGGGMLPSDVGPMATVHGHRIGDPDPQWCAEIQSAYIRQYIVGALTPRP